jgi:hypothetical protein
MFEEPERSFVEVKKTYIWRCLTKTKFPLVNFLQILSYKILVYIRIGLGFSNNLDPDSDSAKYLDPDPD